MQKKLSNVVLVFVLVLTMFVSVGVMNAQDEELPVIVVVAFGSSMESGQANLGEFDAMVRERYPDHDVRWAFTAGFIINKLKEAGIDTLFESEVPLKSLDEVYQDLRDEGKTNVVAQLLMIMPGAEMRQALAYRTEGLNVKYGYPLLFYPENIQNTANALAGEFGDEDTATVLCGHGNEAHPDFNAALLQMDEYLRENYDNTFLSVVEGPPEFDGVLEDVLASGVSEVHFVPLMLTEGDHITNDVMGDEEESWKTQIGLPATNATGLASNPEVMEIFLTSIDNLLSQF